MAKGLFSNLKGMDAFGKVTGAASLFLSQTDGFADDRRCEG
jgi:hypothetical protein